SARRLHTGFLGDLGPLADLALEARGKLLRRAADGIGAFACIRSLISGVLSTRMVSPAILFTTSFGVPVSIKWMTRCDHGSGSRSTQYGATSEIADPSSYARPADR